MHNSGIRCGGSSIQLPKSFFWWDNDEIKLVKALERCVFANGVMPLSHRCVWAGINVCVCVGGGRPREIYVQVYR